MAEKGSYFYTSTNYVLPAELCAMFNVILDAKQQSFKLCAFDLIELSWCGKNDKVGILIVFIDCLILFPFVCFSTNTTPKLMNSLRKRHWSCLKVSTGSYVSFIIIVCVIHLLFLY